MDVTHIDIDINGEVQSKDINVKNGKITDEKINENADINGTKLKDSSIPDSKLVSGGSKFAFLKGKKVLFIGDSITDRTIEVPSNWAAHFCALTGAVEYNRGKSGDSIKDRCKWTMSYYIGTDTRGTSVNWGYDNTTPGTGSGGFPQSVDLIIIYVGQNDWGKALSIGSPTDAITLTEQAFVHNAQTRYFMLPNTMCDCMKFMFQRLRSLYPTTPIFFLGMHHVNPDTYTAWSEFTDWDYSTLSGTYKTKTVDGQTVTMETYRQNIEKVCKMFGVPLIDLFDMQMSVLLEADKTAFFSDGLHINSEGGKIMAKYVANKICGYTHNNLRGL